MNRKQHCLRSFGVVEYAQITIERLLHSFSNGVMMQRVRSTERETTR